MRPRPSRRSNLSSVKVAGDLAKEVNYNSSSIVASKEGSASSFTQLLLPYTLHPLIGRQRIVKFSHSRGVWRGVRGSERGVRFNGALSLRGLDNVPLTRPLISNRQILLPPSRALNKTIKRLKYCIALETKHCTHSKRPCCTRSMVLHEEKVSL